LLWAVTVSPAAAEDVSKKWRVAFSAGGYNAKDEVESDSANSLLVLDPCARTATCGPDVNPFLAQYVDPRHDSAVFGKLDVQGALLGTLSVQYAFTQFFVVEGSIGYQTGDIGDVEVSTQFLNDESQVANIPFNFTTFRIPVGEMTRVPMMLTALARLRPRATFNPYFGLGLGYSVNGFEPDPEFDELSRTVDGSRGTPLRVTNSLGAVAGLQTNGDERDLAGATVSLRDSFEWHLVAGAELTVKSKWALYLDVRWVDASRDISVEIDNGSVGSSIPNFTDFADSPIVPHNTEYGPVLVGGCARPEGAVPGDQADCSGGFVDGGRVVLVANTPFVTNCDAESDCRLEFLPEPDGNPDPGVYYVQGGQFNYDGYTLQLGVRYTF
jgi:outer membrane protein W